MLPRLPGIKTVAFTKRIIASNETFAPLGEMKKVRGKRMPPYAVSWYEAVGGRSAQEICSAFKLFIDFHRDIKNFIFWTDN